MNFYEGLITDSISSSISGWTDNFTGLRSSFAGITFPVNPVKGQVFYYDVGSNLYERHVYNGIAWIKELGGDGIAGRLVTWTGPTSLGLSDNTDTDVADAIMAKHYQNHDTGTDDDFSLLSVGKGLKIAEGTNATMGVVTLVAGTATVNTTVVAANSRIFVVNQNGLSPCGSVYISARVVGTSFTILSTEVGDVSDIAWFIVNPV